MDAKEARTDVVLLEQGQFEPALDIVEATFYGVLGTREPYATSSGVECFVGCHALNCYS